LGLGFDGLPSARRKPIEGEPSRGKKSGGEKMNRPDPRSQTPDHRYPQPFWVVALALVLSFIAADASTRPEKIRAGISYYSDELIEDGPIRDIGAELNYEEVFKLYGYYEAIYDERERVTQFIEYKRGDVVRKDTYRYSTQTEVGQHVIEMPGKAAETKALREKKEMDR
jgi:hypothetical protein